MKYLYKRPKAITMWDFSWLERRWPGAGYEDWDYAVSELVKRGYDAVRIDAYPHLFIKDPEGEWTLKPEWNQQDWGAPALTKVSEIRKNLIEFMRVCKKHDVAVGLSAWFREDINNVRMEIKTPQDLANAWISVLDAVRDAGLEDAVLYVDAANEYPAWCPFIYNDAEYRAAHKDGNNDECIIRTDSISKRWAKETLDILRSTYPQYDYTFSQADYYDNLDKLDNSPFDFIEAHLWMTSYTDFYKKIDYNFERFSSKGYENVVKYAEDLYKSDADGWDSKLIEGVKMLADWSKRENKPLITTECWGIVDYKDRPLLNWDWVKHLCEIAVKQAASEGRWLAIATSNFCGPQFNGMWRDVKWHQELTDIIKNAKLPE